jgi:hypothetical protein
MKIYFFSGNLFIDSDFFFFFFGLERRKKYSLKEKFSLEFIYKRKKKKISSSRQNTKDTIEGTF